MMLVIPMAVRRMIDNGFVAGSESFISQYFLMLIAIGAILAVASASRFYLVNWLGERIVADLRSDVFRHLTTLGPGYFDGIHSGEVMSRLTADTTQIKAAAGTALSQAVRSARSVGYVPPADATRPVRLSWWRASWRRPAVYPV